MSYETRRDGAASPAAGSQGTVEPRGLRRFAGIWSLWALGVGAVISGQYSGWNLGFGLGGWGGMLVASVLMTILYLGLVFSIAEMSSAFPHSGAAYFFARAALGPWGGLVTGLFENIEYVLTPAVVVFFIGAYMSAILGTPAAWQPAWWIGFYVVFVALNVLGVELSFRVTLVVTLLALACLVFFWISALPHIGFDRWALDIAAGPAGGAVELPSGGGPLLPFGLAGAFAALPFAAWLFLAIEQLPLASEESIDPARDMPRGIIAGMLTLVVSAFMILWLNPSVEGVGSFRLARSGEPLLEGYRAIYGDEIAKVLAFIAVIGLVASFHAVIYAKGRQIHSMARAGYLPSFLSPTHASFKTPHAAMVAGAVVALVVMLALWGLYGTESGGTLIGGMLLNMAVFGAMCSYMLQAYSFIRARDHKADSERPYRSPLGIPGAVATIVIAFLTLVFQLAIPTYREGIVWIAIWLVLGAAYFALRGRRRFILLSGREGASRNARPLPLSKLSSGK
jgi:ethanolamine permease